MVSIHNKYTGKEFKKSAAITISKFFILPLKTFRPLKFLEKWLTLHKHERQNIYPNAIANTHPKLVYYMQWF